MNSKGRTPTVEEAFEELLLYYSHETGRTIVELRDLVSLDTSLMTFGILDSDLDWIGFFTHFGIHCPEKFTDNLNEQSLVRDFCVYLSKHIFIPNIEAVPLLGKPCKSAGMFLDIKQKLIERGENENAIAPSSDLKPFLAKHKDFFRSVRWYTPGKIPVLKVRNRVAEWGCLSLIFVVLASGLYGGITAKLAPNMPSMTIFTIILASLSVTCFGIGSIYRKQFETASFDGLTDFRSLVDALLNRPPSRPNKFKLARGNPQ